MFSKEYEKYHSNKRLKPVQAVPVSAPAKRRRGPLSTNATLIIRSLQREETHLRSEIQKKEKEIEYTRALTENRSARIQVGAFSLVHSLLPLFCACTSFFLLDPFFYT